MRMSKENGKLREEDIIDFESKIGKKLPIHYRIWLSETGGGELIDSAIVSGFEDEPIADIPELFSIEKILHEMEILGSKIPDSWLPIGTSDGGDVAVMDMLSGEILYLFITRFYGKNFVTRDCAVKIAEDFEQLKQDLRPFDDLLKEIRN